MVAELHSQNNVTAAKFDDVAALRDVLSEHTPVKALIAELDGIIAAFAFFIPTYDSAIAAYGYSVIDFYLSPLGREKSLGEPFIAGCAAYAKYNNASFMRWTSKAWDVVAQNLNRKVGAVEEPVMDHLLKAAAFSRLADEGVAYLSTT